MLDRDGVINEMVYYPEHGFVDSPFTVKQFELVRKIGRPLRKLRYLGYKLVVVSNQPGVAKEHFSTNTLERMNGKMRSLLAKQGVRLDGEYYCLHHPEAKIADYRLECECRKPKPGLFFKAANELGLSLGKSWVVGDGLVDILAGQRAGCKTVLLSNTNSLLYRLMDEMGAEPDFQAKTLGDAAKIIEGATVKAGG